MATATQTQTRTAQITLDRTDTGFFLALGFTVWLVATAVTRLAGPVLLRPESPVVTGVIYLLMVPSMAVLALVAFRLRGVTGVERVLAGVLMVLPGMVLDSLVVPFFTTVFPGVAPSMAGAFGGILLIAYAVVLETAYLSR